MSLKWGNNFCLENAEINVVNALTSVSQRVCLDKETIYELFLILVHFLPVDARMRLKQSLKGTYKMQPQHASHKHSFQTFSHAICSATVGTAEVFQKEMLSFAYYQ